MLAGFRDEVGPEGKTVADRPTVPTKPVLVTVIVDVADSPTSILDGRLVEEMAKSLLTVRVTMVVCDSEPLLAVTVTR
jgi:hypothetical protein